MSVGLPPIEWGLHTAGIKLITLDKERGYFKIFGNNEIRGADFELTCALSWLENLESYDKPGGIREEKRVYDCIKKDLATLVTSIDTYARKGRNTENFPAVQRFHTVERYAQNHQQPYDASSLRYQFQSYDLLLENIYVGRTLSLAENETRLQFIQFVKFFQRLEERHEARSSRWLDALHEALE